jgi:hypothetical protein
MFLDYHVTGVSTIFSVAKLAQLRGFAPDFAEGEKIFPDKSAHGLWITPGKRV